MFEMVNVEKTNIKSLLLPILYLVSNTLLHSVDLHDGHKVKNELYIV